MRFYQIPKWFRSIYNGAIWDFFSEKEKVIYLTFDDGPDVNSTHIILEMLQKHNARATFFCLGENVKNNPQLFEQLKSNGHTIGNHGMKHLDGFKTSTEKYLENASEAARIIASDLYRPAYGRIKKSQYKELTKRGFRIIFWSLLTYDFDAKLPSEKRMNLIRKKTKPGSILVFHDSAKAIAQLKHELPTLLEAWSKEGFSFKPIQLRK